ncbi:aldo-keto reductase family 1 member B1-like [Condylostylus longicornis]|uniref:aldo-keto reductase family 1 member B1-like n=1 Tax=Condylostylus longicornis TaxID=2530218 RepID=UPI00244DA956|nr:aldo-keto reductase family 1 member B1-like [Condylostylus longicornis]
MALKLAPKVKLNDGNEMPVLGLGTWRSYENDAEFSVKCAIDCGYRHIDTAYVYENEAEVGRAVRAKIQEGVVKREDLFIVTKLASHHHDPNVVEKACRESLSNLQLDYVDLYLIHFPVGMDFDYLDTWKAMEKLVPLGLTKSIGISNFNSEQTKRIVENCTIKPVTNQVECHPGFNQQKLIDFSKKYDIIITAYCPLARPKPEMKLPSFLFDEKTEAIASKHGKTATQVVLRYLIQHGVVPIPKSVNPQRIKQNFDVFDFELNSDEMKVMDSFNTKHRTIPFSQLRTAKHFPFNIEF